MRKYLSGDALAFDAIYSRYSGRVYGFLLGKLKHREEADEIFQAVFMKLHRSRSQYDSKYPLLQWLFVIARSVYLDHLRKQSREVPVNAEADLADVADQVSQTSGASSLTGQEDDPSVILKDLNAEQREIVTGRVVEELSYAEIAARIGKSEPSVRQIFSRAMKRLRVTRSES